MSLCCKCCVLSGRGLCDEVITRPEESYRLWCVVVCDLEISWMRRPWHAGGCCAKRKKCKRYPFEAGLITLKNGSFLLCLGRNRMQPFSYVTLLRDRKEVEILFEISKNRPVRHKILGGKWNKTKKLFNSLNDLPYTYISCMFVTGFNVSNTVSVCFERMSKTICYTHIFTAYSSTLYNFSYEPNFIPILRFVFAYQMSARLWTKFVIFKFC